MGKSKEVLHDYELDVRGADPDIIEFVPRSSPNKICIVVSKSGYGTAMFCFDKEKKEK